KAKANLADLRGKSPRLFLFLVPFDLRVAQAQYLDSVGWNSCRCRDGFCTPKRPTSLALRPLQEFVDPCAIPPIPYFSRHPLADYTDGRDDQREGKWNALKI